MRIGTGTGRIIAALAIALGGIGLAVWAGAGLTGALLACLAGMAALAIALRPQPMHTPEPPARGEGAGLPHISDLLDAVSTPLLIVRNGHVRLANHAARTLLGQHIEGGDIRLAIRHPAAAERLTAAEAEAISEEVELAGIGSVDSLWSMNVSPVPPDSLLVRLTDLSTARAVEKMRADFVANASHELRTPLATLLGFLETLEDEAAAGDHKTRRRFLTIMSEEAARMRNLIDDLMSLSRIEADRFTAPAETVDLLPLLESVFNACRGFAESRGSALTIENRSSRTIVSGDRAQLAQLFNNLVTNALKYGRPGTPVRVQLTETGTGLIRARVIDEGEGIAAEHLPRLTERFYRVDPGRSRAGGGTGLGLAIARHIALRHRGQLEIASEPGKGTSVSVCLPLSEASGPRPGPSS